MSTNLQPTAGTNAAPTPAPAAKSPKPMGPWRLTWNKFRRNPFAMSGLVVLSIFVIAAIFAPWLAPHKPDAVNYYANSLKPGEQGYILGTDELGRDILSRLLYSARISLSVGFAVAAGAVLIGTLIGSMSGFFGGWVDIIFMRWVDVMNSVPLLFLNILILAIFGDSFWYMIGIMIFTSWMGVARLVRGSFLQLREMQFVEAAKAIGVSSWGIIFRHLLRNASFPIIVNATLMVGGAILAESGLSYLGLGIQSPQTSWGQMLSKAQEFMLVDPMQGVYPGLCILLVVLAVNFIGDGIRDALDPRQKMHLSPRRLEQWRAKFSKSTK
ncbi:ABC transporter permease [Paenibacillus pasadenensis]|uniref:ABC transporter permease n=1 Tax=Paenibacillus pasadenensis TaxID=217090 RepID=UPI00203CE8F4|nr:ABC transporter permease [Paenibacillus pasadenensis]MCM3748286.1 ABC transporter permease [Paenibacillus pasadenensis]